MSWFSWEDLKKGCVIALTLYILYLHTGPAWVANAQSEAPAEFPAQTENAEDTVQEEPDLEAQSEVGEVKSLNQPQPAQKAPAIEEDKGGADERVAKAGDNNDQQLHSGSTEDTVAYWTRISAISTAAYTLITVFVLYFLFRTYRETRRAADINGKMLAAGNRAWIKAEIVDVEFNEHHGLPSYGLQIRIENIGNSPAFDVHTNVVLVTGTLDAWVPAKRLAQSCLTEHEVHGLSSGRSLFPGQHYIRYWSLGHEPNNPLDKAMFVGCINYKTIYDSEIHQTVFVYAHGWDGMGPRPEDELSSVNVWSGGFAT